MAATETGGTWAQAVKVNAPSGVSELLGVSCTSVGNCEAVGLDYIPGANEALAATETAGTWGNAVEVTLPGDAGTNQAAGVGLDGVSCTSVGNCVAVGSYIDGSGNEQAMTATEAGGTWGQAVKVTAPSDAGTNPTGSLDGVSCTSAGNCVAVGSYIDGSGHEQAMTATEAGGTWGQAVKVTAPSDAGTNPTASLGGVSCTSAGNCVAVGAYSDSSANGQAMAATEAGGTWGQAVKVTAPSDAGTNPSASLRGVSCTSAGNCDAVGIYASTSGSAVTAALAASEASGTWGQAAVVSPPSDALTQGDLVTLAGVSCPSAGNCVAVGNYGDNSSHFQAMAASQAISPPTVTVISVSPPYGPTAGGTSVVITGTDFTGTTGASGVTFGGTDATSYKVVSDTEITATVPAGSVGAVDVVVNAPGGAGTDMGGFNYESAASVTSVNPAYGRTAGLTSVIITGTNFSGTTGVSGVTFGGNDATSYAVDSATQITATTPAGSVGAVDVVVNAPGGRGTKVSGFTYESAATVTQVNPNVGPTAGGTSVTITGTNFSGTSGASGVTFGGTDATSYTVVSDTEITATTPAASARAVDVVVNAPGGAGTKVSGFTYESAAATTLTWTGMGDNSAWSNPANWSPQETPASGDTLDFPAQANKSYSANNDITGLDLAQILVSGSCDASFSEAGISLTGDSFGLSGGIAGSGYTAVPNCFEGMTIFNAGLSLDAGNHVLSAPCPQCALLINGTVSGSASLEFAQGQIQVNPGLDASDMSGLTFASNTFTGNVVVDAGATVSISDQGHAGIVLVPSSQVTVNGFLAVTNSSATADGLASTTHVTVNSGGGFFTAGPTSFASLADDGYLNLEPTSVLVGSQLEPAATQMRLGSLTLSSSSSTTFLLCGAGGSNFTQIVVSGSAPQVGGTFIRAPLEYGDPYCSSQAAPIVFNLVVSSGPVLGSFTNAPSGTLDTVYGDPYQLSYGIGDGIALKQTATVTKLSPAIGPSTGGTEVTITGTGFSTIPGITQFDFGLNNPASNVSCSSTTSCTATTPSGSGTVDVTVTLVGGLGTGSVLFTYIPAFSLLAYPVQAIVGKPFNSANGNNVVGAITINTSSAPVPTPITAQVAWGDGASSPGTIQPGPVGTSESVFYVQGKHTYLSQISNGVLTVTAQVGTTTLTAHAHVTVLPEKPQAFFVVNPALGTQNQVSLLTPAAQGPGQQPILGYEWISTADTNHPIYDTPQTRPEYACIINGLIASGGTDGAATCNGQFIPSFIQGAIQLGILPDTTNNFIGGLTSSDILTIAHLWEVYYPQHIIPYVFPYFSEKQTSHVAFSLAIGVAGDKTLPGCLGVFGNPQCWTVPNVTVEPDCALVTAIFGWSSTCDLGDFKPRAPDYVAVNVTGVAADVLAVQGAISVVVSHGILDSPSNDDVFVQFSVGGGLGIGGGVGVSATTGWVNGPFSSTPNDSEVNDFVDHCTVSGGGGLGISIGPVSLGASAVGVDSPTGLPGFTTGFETSAQGGPSGGAGGSAIAGVSENYALSLGELGVPLSTNDLTALQSLFTGVAGGSISPTTLTNDATTVLNSIPSFQTVANDISEALGGLQALNTGCGLLGPK